VESANADVFYFSGSGNSLVVARDIAKELDGNLIPIPSIMDKTTIETDAEVIGIVFPVYYADFGGIPLINLEIC
jgi:flavodoxin